MKDFLGKVGDSFEQKVLLTLYLYFNTSDNFITLKKLMSSIAIRNVEFSSRGYNIRKTFG